MIFLQLLDVVKESEFCIKLVPSTSHEKFLFIFMQMADRDLHHEIGLHGLKKEAVQIWGAQLVKAVEFLHTRQIIHCDIKPSNVLLRNNQVKLGDFGESKKLQSSTQKVSNNTKWGQNVE